ncbi:MAG: hypothetical protein DI601_09450 [Azospirillum brasilense]|nr:MAG: hypothetical protein DI601_09450 [Azospirillum brasilense]
MREGAPPRVVPLGGLLPLEDGESFVGYLGRYAFGLGLTPFEKALDRLGLANRFLETTALEIHDPDLTEEIRQFLNLDAGTFDRLRSWGSEPLTARILGHDVPDALVSIHRRRCCPDCYRERPYHRSIWDLTVLTGCSRHRTTLRGECSACRTRFRWGSTAAPCCPSPDCCLPFEEQAPGLSMEDDATEGCRLVEDLLRNGVPVGAAPLTVGETLVGASVLGAFLSGRRPQAIRPASRQEPLWLAEVMGKGLKALRPWPTSFHACLSEIQLKRDTHPGRFGIRKELGPFALWMVQNRDTRLGKILAEATDSWAAAQPTLVTRIAAVVRRRAADPNSKFITTAQAAARLGYKDAVFRKFAARKGIATLPAEGSGSRILVSSELVDQLAEVDADLIDVSECGEMLNLGRAKVYKLAEAGLIRRFQKDYILDVSRPFSRRSVQELLAALEGKVPTGAGSSGRYSGRAAAAVNVGGVVDLIRQVLQGDVVPVSLDHDALGIDRLRFDSVPKRQAAPPADGLISFAEFRDRMGLARNTLCEFMSAGLFEGIDADGRRRTGKVPLPVSAISAFERDYILTPEIARRAGLPWQGLATRLAGLGVRPISGPGVDGRARHVFRRGDVERILGMMAEAVRTRA